MIMGVLSALQPASVMHWFEAISNIPRGSLKEHKLADFLVEFAKERGYEYTRDDYNNVCIKKPGSAGKEKDPPVILQAHTDMICAKDPGVEHDFDNDGLELYIDGDHICARGTTLGADDGAGVAYELAVLDDKDLVHPPIEAVFTTAEEIGMVGALHYDMSALTGKRMINFDAGGFTEGRIYVGCAGNCRVQFRQTMAYQPPTAKTALKLTLSGLKGGHSGGDISLGRANGSLIMGRLLLWLVSRDDTQLAGFGSGDPIYENKNGITDRCTITLLTDAPEAIVAGAAQWQATLNDEFSGIEENIVVAVKETAAPTQVLTRESVLTVARVLGLLPNGVLSMQRVFPDTPECSCNVGNVELEGGITTYYLSIRSCKSSLIEAVCDKLTGLAALSGVEMEVGMKLPCWDYDPNSQIKKLVDEEYRREFGTAPRFKVTHASTECALFKETLPDLDIISMGPIIYEEHTTKEYMGIWSVGILWEFLKNILRQL